MDLQQLDVLTGWSTWRVIDVGEYKNIRDLRNALTEARIETSRWTRDILKRVKISKDPRALSLISLLQINLGFSAPQTYDEICARASQLGLEFCPAEAGPILRLLYRDQPAGERTVIAMMPIPDSENHPDIFALNRRADRLRLDAEDGSAASVWPLNVRFVFASPN